MKKWKIYKTKRKNELAKELSEKKFRQRVVHPKKIYKREKINIKDVEQDN